MKVVELYGRVRYAVQIEGLSRRAAARQFGIDPRTVAKMLAFSVPPGYRRRRPPARPKLDPFIGIIEAILATDETRPKKQRHTAKRIFERLRDEHGYRGGITIVRDYVRVHRLQHREVFVPLRHDPGHAQVDFGEALAEIAGVERKIHFFAMDLPHSDASFVQAYPAETTEAFCDGHNGAFAFFGRVPRSILYDNTKLAVARILGDGVRQRTRVFSELQSHYVFADRFGRPGKGNDKGKVEGLIGWVRRNLLVPVPRATSLTALNEQLLEGCRRRLGDRLRGHQETIGERLVRDLATFHDLPPAPYDACEKRAGRVSSLSLVRYRGTDYSVPVPQHPAGTRANGIAVRHMVVAPRKIRHRMYEGQGAGAAGCHTADARLGRVRHQKGGVMRSAHAVAHPHLKWTFCESAAVPVRSADAASHSFSFDHLRRPDTLRTAMATAFFWPTSTTSRSPIVVS